MKTIKFAMMVGPTGEIMILSEKEAVIARRVAGLTELDPGGQIVMSTDVNAEVGAGFKGWAKGFMKTWWNRLMRSSKIDEEIKRLLSEKGLDTGWSIGNLFRGRYFSPKNDQMFNEKSFAVEIRGVPFKFVKDVGEALRKKFDQEAVLLVNFENNRTYLLD